MEEKDYREVVFYEDHFARFLQPLRGEVKQKIVSTLRLVAQLPRLPAKFFKSIQGSKGLFEIRIEVGSDIYRVFCFFDRGQLVVLLNGFQKKGNKTPRKEIEKAEKLKANYFNDKSHGGETKNN